MKTEKKQCDLSGKMRTETMESLVISMVGIDIDFTKSIIRLIEDLTQ